ncbi:MAG: RrF2 family transcriptional regulator [Enterococcus sp.]
MKYTKATNHALHIMAFMVMQESTMNISLVPLAEKFNISSTYLSKILTQLVKANLIHSSPGVNGGYSLRKDRAEITYLDVTKAIEGTGHLFTCEMNDQECHLQQVMRDAEKQMENYLQSKTLLETMQETNKITKPHQDCKN